MSIKFKIFLITFVLSLPFWWGMNLLEKNLKDFFFWQKISQNPQIFTAQIAMEEKLESLKPFRNREVENLEIEAKSTASVFINDNGGKRILFEKEIDKKLPIASLTKLMTAFVVLENYDLSKEIKISKEAIEQEEDFGKLKLGKVFKVEYLLYPLLMESSNDAAFSLANDYDGMTEEKFIELMNLKAQQINLENTFFINSSGLDLDEPERKTNYSTVNDLIILTKELLKKPLIWEILSTSEFNSYGPALNNTNELLGEIPEIIGGKTGYTEKSGGCFLLVLKAPKNKGYLINVILGSNDRFGEMRKLIDWTYKTYRW